MASARADSAEQLSVDDCVLSARADNIAAHLALVAMANSRLYAASSAKLRAEEDLREAIRAASRAGASVRRIAPIASMGKMRVAQVAREEPIRGGS